MSRPVDDTLCRAAFLAVLILFATGGAAAAADAPVAATPGSVSVDAMAFDEDAAGPAESLRALLGDVGHDVTDVGEDPRGVPVEAAPVEFTGIVDEYLNLRRLAPANYLDMIRAIEPEPWM